MAMSRAASPVVPEHEGAVGELPSLQVLLVFLQAHNTSMN